MNLVDAFSEFLRFSEILRGPLPTDGGSVVVVEMLEFLGLVSIAFLIGLMIGWVWKPKWASFQDCKYEGSVFKNQKVESSRNPNQDLDPQPVQTELHYSSCSSLVVKQEDGHLLKDEDLKHLWHLVEKRDGGPPWKHMMDRSTQTMTYQAWQRDRQTGPPEYCSITIYEDATPELLRDFFWDDDLRLKWDDMLLYAKTLEEFPDTGASVVHWIRKFPFFCSDREYTIGRRIWELDGSYYCVTKGVSCSSVPRKQKPRRVDVYYSSWFIRPAKSKKGKNQPACEVIFFHHEDMGIPWEISKLGVRQGMWGTVKKIEQGFRWYQNERASSKTVSRHVVMAQMSTKIDQNYLARLEADEDIDTSRNEMLATEEKQGGIHINIPKILVISGAVLLACSLDRGLLTKAVTFGIARRFGNIGKRAFPTTRL